MFDVSIFVLFIWFYNKILELQEDFLFSFTFIIDLSTMLPYHNRSLCDLLKLQWYQLDSVLKIRVLILVFSIVIFSISVPC